MKIEPSGVVFVGVCDIQTHRCLATQPAPITAVWGSPGRWQINVCSPCLGEQVRRGEWEIEGARIDRRADVAVYAPGRKLLLVAEVKRSADVKPPLREAAIRIHRNLITHSGIPGASYFLLALLPDSLYLWKGNGQAEAARAPDYEFDAQELLKPYFELLATSSSQASQFQLETVIKLWLKDVASAKDISLAAGEGLRESGLYEALKNGIVELETAIAA